MISLTKPQHNVLRFIAGHIEAKGCAPTYAEIAAGLGFKTKTNAFRIVRLLKERGAVEGHRRITLTGKVAIPRAPDGEPLFFVPAPEGRP